MVLNVGTNKKPFAVGAYSMGDAGYPVYRTWALDNGTGRGGCREASFVCDSAAQDYAKYRNKLFVKNGHDGIGQ